MSRPVTRSRGLFAVLSWLAVTSPALAGPPLLCHPFDIGDAQSLPWGDGRSWLAGLADYPVSRLAADTQALLGPSTPVIVRMETLRRAAIYASRDAQVAAGLFTVLMNRAQAAGRARLADAMALFDAAYYVEALRELSELTQSPDMRDRAPALRAIVHDSDGYALARQATALRPSDPALQFGAALIASERHREAYAEHAAKARAGATADMLLARNIAQVR